MVNLLLLPFRLIFIFVSTVFLIVLLPFRLLLSLSFTLIALIEVLFMIAGIILAVTIVGIIPGALLGLFGLGLIALGKSK